jgi:hypothetical protein
MATRSKTVTQLGTFGDDVQIVTWSGLLQSSTDDGDPYECPGASDRSVQLGGTLGAGGVATIEGSNNGSNWAALTDPQGNAIELNAIGAIEAVSELTRYVRPRITGGDGTTNLTVTLLAKR